MTNLVSNFVPYASILDCTCTYAILTTCDCILDCLCPVFGANCSSGSRQPYLVHTDHGTFKLPIKF